MLVHSGFPNAKELLRKLSAVLTYTLKNVQQRCPRPQKFEEYRFEGRQTFSLPGAPIYKGWNFNSGNYLFTTDTK